MHFETGGHSVRFSFRMICPKIMLPHCKFFDSMPKLPSSFMLNNQNIKQKPIPSAFTSLIFFLSSLYWLCLLLLLLFLLLLFFFLFFTGQHKWSTQYTCLFFSFWVCQPTTLHFNLTPTKWMSLHLSLIFFFSTFNFHFLHFIFISFF